MENILKLSGPGHYNEVTLLKWGGLSRKKWTPYFIFLLVQEYQNIWTPQN